MPGLYEEHIYDVNADNGIEALEAIRRMRELVHGMRTAMLTTTNAEGHLHGRPMETLQSEDHDELWCYIDARSGIIDDITVSPQVNLAYLDASGKRFVSASGVAHVIRDQNLLDGFWNRRAATWFPEGPDREPHLALLRVQLEEVECWDAGAKSILRLRGMARSQENVVEPRRASRPAFELPGS